MQTGNWYLNLAPQPQQWTYFKNGKIKFPKKAIKWSILPLRMTMQYFTGEYSPVKYEAFDPGSRNKIVKWLRHYHGFEFPIFTEKGNPSVDPEDLTGLGHEGELMTRYLTVVKALGQLSEGDGSILGNLRHDSTVKCRMDQNGTNTGRFTVSSINIAQIDSSPKFRKLFTVPEVAYEIPDNLYQQLNNKDTE